MKQVIRLTENKIRSIISEVVKDVLDNYVQRNMDNFEYPVDTDYSHTDEFKGIFNNQVKNAIGNEEDYDILMRHLNGEKKSEIAKMYETSPQNINFRINSIISKLSNNKVLKDKISALLNGDYNANRLSDINIEKDKRDKSFESFAEYAYGLYVAIMPIDKMRENPKFPNWQIPRLCRKNTFFDRLKKSNVMSNMTREGVANFIKDNWDEFVWDRIPHNWYRPGRGRKRIDDIYGTIAKNRLDSLFLPFY